MTDKEIINALEKQVKHMLDGYQTYLEHGGKRDEALEEDVDAWSAAVNLINRQKAEIEKLEKTAYFVPARGCGKTRTVMGKIYDIRAEAIKEFAERLKKEMSFGRYIQFDQIDNLVKEMEEQNV